MIKLTELRLDFNNNVNSKSIYVNPSHIKLFREFYSENYKRTLTSIDFGQVGASSTFVAETPDRILQLIQESQYAKL